MKSASWLTVGCGFSLLSLLVACASTERSAPNASAGASDARSGGANGGGAPDAADADSGSDLPDAGSASGLATAGSSTDGSPAGSGGTVGDVSYGGAAGAGPAASDGGAASGAGAAGQVVEGGPLLKNGSFELGGLAGWQVTVTPKSVGRAIFTQWGSPQGVSFDGKFELSIFNDSAGFTGDIQQVVTGLSPGKYHLNVEIGYGSGFNALYLYAIDCGPADVRVDLPLTANKPNWTPFSIPTIDVTSSTCTLGLFVDANPKNWLSADAFVFEPVNTP